MKIILLSVLFTLFSFGQESGGDAAPKLVIDNTDSAQEAELSGKKLPLQKAMDSIVTVFFIRQDGTHVVNMGFIAKNKKGEVGVVTQFAFLDYAVTQNNSLFILSKNKTFEVKAVKKISPMDDLLFLAVKGELESPPLQLAPTNNHKAGDLYLYTVKDDPQYWFSAKRVQNSFSFFGRQDFILSSTIEEIHSLILNSKGEVVSLTTSRDQYVHYGVPLLNLKNFLHQTSYNCYHIRGCVVEARKKLYDKAKKGNTKAQYRLVLLAQIRRSIFEDLMLSIGIEDPHQIQKDWKMFNKGLIEWESSIFYKNIMNSTMSNQEKKKNLKLLSQNQTVKVLAEKGHPAYQYILSHVYFYLGFHNQTSHWLEQSVNKQYVPSLLVLDLFFAVKYFIQLRKLSEKNYKPAQQLIKKLISIIETNKAPPLYNETDLFLNKARLIHQNILKKEKQQKTKLNHNDVQFKTAVESLKFNLTLVKIMKNLKDPWTDKDRLSKHNGRIMVLFEENALPSSLKNSCAVNFELP